MSCFFAILVRQIPFRPPFVSHIFHPPSGASDKKRIPLFSLLLLPLPRWLFLQSWWEERRRRRRRKRDILKAAAERGGEKKAFLLRPHHWGRRGRPYREEEEEKSSLEAREREGKNLLPWLKGGSLLPFSL